MVIEIENTRIGWAEESISKAENIVKITQNAAEWDIEMENMKSSETGRR